MNGIVRTVLRTSTIRSLLSSTPSAAIVNGQVTRNIWKACGRQAPLAVIATPKTHKPFELCGCGCNRAAHTKAEKELVEFLAEEIVAEKKAQKLKTIPVEINGFKVSLDGADVTLEKSLGSDKIKIEFNINHTVDANAEPDIDGREDTPEIGEMKSKPNFSVDIIRGNQTLSFMCAINNEPGPSGANESYNDIFSIEEISLYEGEHNDTVYAVAGDIVDGYLYDLLMNYLEEKGVSNEFVEKLIELSTNYEHSAYVSLLEGLSKFTLSK